MSLSANQEKYSEALDQIFAARAARWRETFADHAWIVMKEENQSFYQVVQVIGL